MSYVKKTLSKDEEIRENLKLHWVNFVFPICLCILFLPVTMASIGIMIEENKEISQHIITLLILWLIPLYQFLRLRSIEMIVTNKRVVFKSGIISTTTEELKNQKVESVEIKQGILDRILGCGSIWFSGTGTSKVKFVSIDNPWEVKSRIEEYIGD